jgi:hypothetical protein
MPVLREIVDELVTVLDEVTAFQEVKIGPRDFTTVQPIPACYVYPADQTETGGTDGNKSKSAEVWVQVVGTSEVGSLSRIEDLAAAVEDKLDGNRYLNGKALLADDRSWDYGYQVWSKLSSRAQALCKLRIDFETARGAN